MKKSLILLITLSVLSLMVIGVYSYVYIQITNTSKTVAMLSADLQTQKTEAENLEHLKDLATQANSNRNKLLKYIAPGGQTDKMISLVEVLAKETGAESTLGSLNVQNNENLPANLEELTMTFVLSGSWKQVISFEKTLETMPYKVTIKSLQLQGSRPAESGKGTQKQTQWSGAYTFSIVKEKDKDEVL